MASHIKKVYNYIVRGIRTEQFPPNAHLFETNLANELGISRSPVREAFNQLVKEGVLIRENNRGVRVAMIPIDQAGMIERLSILELFLIDHLFYLERNRLELPPRFFSDIEILIDEQGKLNISKATDLFPSIEALFSQNKNEFMRELVHQILNAFQRKTTQLNQTMRNSSKETFERYVPKIIEQLKLSNYPEARKLIRITVNQIKIDLIQG